jgi:hypothetical protein
VLLHLYDWREQCHTLQTLLHDSFERDHSSCLTAQSDVLEENVKFALPIKYNDKQQSQRERVCEYVCDGAKRLSRRDSVVNPQMPGEDNRLTSIARMYITPLTSGVR